MTAGSKPGGGQDGWSRVSGLMGFSFRTTITTRPWVGAAPAGDGSEGLIVVSLFFFFLASFSSRSLFHCSCSCVCVARLCVLPLAHTHTRANVRTKRYYGASPIARGNARCPVPQYKTPWAGTVDAFTEINGVSDDIAVTAPFSPPFPCLFRSTLFAARLCPLRASVSSTVLPSPCVVAYYVRSLATKHDGNGDDEDDDADDDDDGDDAARFRYF